MANSPSPFTFLWQALLLPSKNPKLFSNIFLIYILSYVVLYISFQLSVAPLISKFIELAKLLPTIDHSSPKFIELLNTFKAVIKELLIIEIVFYVFLFVISCFLSIIMYCANSTAYLGEMLTLKELLNKVKGIIKGPIITYLFVSLFTFIYLFMLITIVFIIEIVSRIYSIDISSSRLLVTLFSLLATLLLFYLAIIWAMGVAISVIEQKFYGLGAISYATKLSKGKKMQVFLLFLVLIIAPVIKYGFKAILGMFPSGFEAGISVPGLVYQLLVQVVSFYATMAITVLYYECNQSNEGDESNVGYNQISHYTTSIV